MSDDRLDVRMELFRGGECTAGVTMSFDEEHGRMVRCSDPSKISVLDLAWINTVCDRLQEFVREELARRNGLLPADVQSFLGMTPSTDGDDEFMDPGQLSKTGQEHT